MEKHLAERFDGKRSGEYPGVFNLNACSVLVRSMTETYLGVYLDVL